MHRILDFIFYLPAVLFLASGLPQMAKLLRTKKSEDVSLWMYLITCLAILIVMVNALVSRSASIFVSNLASFLITGTNTLLIVKYRRTGKDAAAALSAEM